MSKPTFKRRHFGKGQNAALKEAMDSITPATKRQRTSQMIDCSGTTTHVPAPPLPSPSKSRVPPRPNPPPPVLHLSALEAKPVEAEMEDPDVEKSEKERAEEEVSDEKIPLEELLKQDKTRRRRVLGDWETKLDQAALLIFKREAHADIGTRCGCGNGIRQVRCYDCLQLPLLCKDCWVQAHKHDSLHWAHVWVPGGFFVKHDISALGHSIPLGHEGGQCPKPKPDRSLIIAHMNGVHSTKVSFCGCEKAALRDKWTQLFDHGFLPSTVLDPHSCFTFSLMRQYTMLHWQCHVTPFNYIKAIRRLTNNVGTADVPDLFKQFTLAERIWDFVQVEGRAGVHHKLSQFLPEPPANDLIVECPSCPHPGVNMEPGWEKTPEALGHLHMTRLTLDGNYHANHYAKGKNADQNDISLWAGRGYFPIESVYNQHCGLKEATSAEKSVCGHLNTISKQNKAKFKNMDISGIVNCQCCHVFTRSSANLKCAERSGVSPVPIPHLADHHITIRWVCVDECLARAVKQTFSSNPKAPRGRVVVSYDAMCALCKYIIDRWLEMHPDYAHIVNDAYWVIPVCHCRNHIDSCEPMFLYVYKDGVGTFKGETAEQLWDHLNGFGASNRQRNKGSREDAYNGAFGDLNWRKTVGIATQLYNEVTDLKTLYKRNRDFLIGLWHLYEDKAIQWNAEDRSPRVDPKRKRSVISVYQHNDDGKAPTLRSMLDELKGSLEDFETPTGRKKLGAAAAFLDEGVALAITREHLLRLVKKHPKFNPDSQEGKEITSRREKYRVRLDKFHKAQGKFMKADAATKYPPQPSREPEQQEIALPSKFTPTERVEYDLVLLADGQVKLVEGRLYDIVRELQRSAKTLTQARDRKKKNGGSQDKNTRALAVILEMQEIRDKHVREYRILREMLSDLGALDEAEWPYLKMEDTYRKSTEQRRAPGASRIEEGSLWGKVGLAHKQQGPSKSDSPQELQPSQKAVHDGPSLYGTQMSTSNKRGNAKKRAERKAPDHEAPSVGATAQKRSYEEMANVEETEIDPGEQEIGGWIWGNRVVLQKMTPEEIVKWREKGDRTHFFKADAEFERVREELEYKHACFDRTIRFFATKHDHWSRAALNAEKDGMVGMAGMAGMAAYAKEKAAMYDALRADCQKKFESCGIPDFVHIPEGKTLADQVAAFRLQEDKRFPEPRDEKRPAFHDPTIHAKGFKDTREGVEGTGDPTPV
ncbi:hypothetical protein AAF712_013871 [Marasmius tenuissimus]|uniref:CxC2-like cysteine cluster KDZ transposase-associated domain-containing protein n=1 Tax=Marasmius tenuissimus TaxID=585030 RepID=A0ABR2ZDM3_9AGAR